MVLIPLLTLVGGLGQEEIFPASLSIILPVCVVCLVMTGDFPLQAAAPYLLGSGLGGLLAGKWGRKIPVLWLHRGLGLLILWGGFRYLW